MGKGETRVNRFLSAKNISATLHTLLKRCERKVGTQIMKLVEKSSEKAVKLEKELAIK